MYRAPLAILAHERVSAAEPARERLPARGTAQRPRRAQLPRIAAERHDDAVDQRDRLEAVAGRGPAGNELRLPLPLARAGDEHQVVGDHALERRAVLLELCAVEAVGEFGQAGSI